MTLSEKHKDEIADILSRYPVKRSALIPLLYLAQREHGYVPETGREIPHSSMQVAHVRLGRLGHDDRMD
jgi:NADH:ubiquinone oxidoreductase subunit E